MMTKRTDPITVPELIAENARIRRELLKTRRLSNDIAEIASKAGSISGRNDNLVGEHAAMVDALKNIVRLFEAEGANVDTDMNMCNIAINTLKSVEKDIGMSTTWVHPYVGRTVAMGKSE